MDIKPGSGRRIHFSKILSSTPVLIAGAGVRDAIVIVNEGSAAVRVGHSGTVATLGTYLGGGLSLSDNYSQDDYWGYIGSGSGTVSGFVVVGG